MTDKNDLTKQQLINRIEQLETELEEKESVSISRRSVLARATGIASAGALGLTAIGSVSAAPTGTIPSPSNEPFKTIRADQMRLVARSSKASTPPSGTVKITYRSDL